MDGGEIRNNGKHKGTAVHNNQISSKWFEITPQLYHRPNISLVAAESIDNTCYNAYIYFGVFAIFSAIPNQNEA